MFDLSREEKLCDELQGHVVQMPSGLNFIKHPFVNTMYGGSLQEGALYNMQLKLRREQYEKYLAEGEVAMALGVVERPWRCDYAYRLLLLEEMIPAEKAAEVISWLWTDTENMWENKDAWHDLLMHIEPHRELFMGEDNVKALHALPDKIKIYRGFDDLQGDDAGYSWTLSQETAWWFAKRFGEDPQVIEMTINKGDAFALLMDDRKESEIIFLGA